MNRNAWQLFSNDLELAMATLESASKPSLSSRLQASRCQILTFFGLFKQAQDWLLSSEPKVIQQHYALGALFRIRQYRNHHNPWLSICRIDQKIWLNNVRSIFERGNAHIRVNLDGGLGDMLEILATLQDQNKDLRERLQLVIPASAESALAPLLEEHQSTHQLTWINQHEANTMRQKPQQISISTMVLKALLADLDAKREPKLQSRLSINKNRTQSRTLLCCWRPKIDPDEKLWAHLRSLDMATIVRLYRELMPIAQQRGIQVVDITRYRDHEAKELLNRHPSGLNLAAPTLRSFVDTTEHFGANTLVASIDTSLIHLACWCDLRPVMLAHRWPDGRWLQGSWQNIDILEQDTLFDWEPVVQRLIQRIRNHTWT